MRSRLRIDLDIHPDPPQLGYPVSWADAELQPSNVRGGEDFTADFRLVHDHFFNNFQLN